MENAREKESHLKQKQKLNEWMNEQQQQQQNRLYCTSNDRCNGFQVMITITKQQQKCCDYSKRFETTTTKSDIAAAL